MIFEIHETFQGSIIGGNLQQILLPEPDAGMVRVPLFANVQNDGVARTSYTCHAVLRRTANPADPGWTLNLSSQFCILWVRKLLADLMVGGEFFIPVDVFPIPRGFEIYVEWTAPDGASGAHCHRTRCVSVQIPGPSFDWSKVATNFGNFKFVAP